MPLKENKIVKLNAIPKELREREHFVFLNDYTTGPCNFKRRAERRICDRLNSYCRAILEEHYSQITGHNIEPKAVNYLINTVYPNARRFKGQKTFKILTVDSSTASNKPGPVAAAVTDDVCDTDGALTESQYRTFIGTKYDKITAAVIFESDRKTHGGSLNTQTSQLTGVYDENDNDVFSMLRQNWQINTFTTTFDVYEQHTVTAGATVTNTYHKYSVKIVLKRVHKLFCDVWRFSDMTITNDTNTATFDGPVWIAKNPFATWNIASYKKTSKKHRDNKKD